MTLLQEMEFKKKLYDMEVKHTNEEIVLLDSLKYLPEFKLLLIEKRFKLNSIKSKLVVLNQVMKITETPMIEDKGGNKNVK